MATLVAEPPTQHREKKRLVRRSSTDRSQQIRHFVQWAFFGLNIYIGAQFYLWVRHFETVGTGPAVGRPPGVEGWLPIAGLMNTKYLISTGQLPPIHPAALFLFLAFVLMSLLLKKAFCSWLCPVGSISEYLWRFGLRVFRQNVRLPRWFDIPLRSLKYLLLGFFSFFIFGMSGEELRGFMQSPYGLMADVKMLNFFRDISLTGALVFGVLVLGSMLMQNFWCRYLCPYGALMGLVSFLSPVKIRRDAEACIDCSKCSRACPAGIAVDKLVQIRSAECTACMECVAVCPAENALQFALPPRKSSPVAARWARRALTPIAVTLVLAYIFIAFVLTARVTNHWQTNIPSSVYTDLVPRANQLGHPGM